MRTTVLAANDLPGGTVVEGPIKLRLPAQDNRRKNIRAAITSLALILVPAGIGIPSGYVACATI